MKEESGETSEKTEQKVMEVFNTIGSNATNKNIDIAHRVGRQVPTRTRPIIVRLTDTKSKTNIMKNKRQLKGKNG